MARAVFTRLQPCQQLFVAIAVVDVHDRINRQNTLEWITACEMMALQVKEELFLEKISEAEVTDAGLVVASPGTENALFWINYSEGVHKL